MLENQFNAARRIANTIIAYDEHYAGDKDAEMIVIPDTWRSLVETAREVLAPHQPKEPDEDKSASAVDADPVSGDPIRKLRHPRKSKPRKR